ncbi:MAG: hypothetical protein DBY37_10485 [Desulfovibrionaceae bacterium]|nr:MAG: hypothetical protein DBY37_10485 [Desulfovibrionaceae bacterium]
MKFPLSPQPAISMCVFSKKEAARSLDSLVQLPSGHWKALAPSRPALRIKRRRRYRTRPRGFLPRYSARPEG